MRGNTTSAIIFLFICAWNVSKAHIEYEVRPIRGVSKKLWSQYQENIFKCILNGVEKLLTFERINDDYCDCDNGTDEPGTGACSHLINSEFFCENGGFFPKKIHTSRVNDGICDCCDGSDEFNKETSICQSTCVNEAAKKKVVAQERLEIFQTGFNKRNNQVKEEVSRFLRDVRYGESTYDRKIRSLNELKDKVLSFKTREEARERRHRVEEARKVESQKVHQTDENEKRPCDSDEEPGAHCVATDASSKEETDDATGEQLFEELDTESFAEDQATTVEAEKENDINAHVVEMSDGSKVTLSEYFRLQREQQNQKKRRLKGSRTAKEMRTQDFLGPIFNGDHEERRKVVIHSLRTIGIVLAPVRALTEIVLYIPLKAWNFLASSTTIGPYAAKVSYLVDAPSLYFRSPTFRRLGGGRYYRWYSNIMWSTSIVWEAPIFAYKYLFPVLSEDIVLSEAASLRRILLNIENEIKKMEEEKDNLKKQMEIDYGPDSAYYVLREKCFEKKIEKYMYKFCPFKEVKQDLTNMGKWDSWSIETLKNGTLQKDYSIMLFKHGQKCWNGPERSVKAILECGQKDRILTVEEPSTCVYEMKIETPSACSEQVLNKAKEDLAYWSQGSK